jgi:N-acetylglutamate synthase-like GNAT family acetyltransferase
MEFNIRMLKDSDWDTLVEWWDSWPEWTAPSKDFLPDNGKGGFMVEKNNQPIVAGFLYTTNSKAALLEWIVSNPKYRESDRNEAVELLIKGAENVCKEQGIKYIFSIGRNKNLIKTHKKLGYQVDDKPSYEIVKII